MPSTRPLRRAWSLSDLILIQAFRFGCAAYYLLFHVEMELHGIETMCQECSADVTRANLTPSSILKHAKPHVPHLHQWADRLLGHLLTQVR